MHMVAARSVPAQAMVCALGVAGADVGAGEDDERLADGEHERDLQDDAGAARPQGARRKRSD